MGRTVAVTGAAGSLGRAVLDQLVADPEFDRIVALDRAKLGRADPKIDARQADVRDAGIVKHFEGCDAVVHLAFIVERGSRDARLVEEVNVGGTQNVCRAAVEAGVGQIVYASSIASYGVHPEHSGKVLTEDTPVRGNPDWYYSRNKAEVETWLDGFEADHPDVVVARMRPTTFLSIKSTQRPVARLFQLPFVPYIRGSDTAMQITDEDDVATAFVLALKKRARGAFNIATDDALRPSEWGRAVGKPSVGLPAASVDLMDAAYRRGLAGVDPVWYRVGSRYPLVVSNKKIRKDLRWKPRYETTGAVLRALAGKPTAGASRATKMIFGGAALVTRLRGGLPMTATERAQVGKINGTINVVFTGPGASEWHVRLRDGVPAFYEGLADAADATVTCKEEDFLRMLAGDLAVTSAQFTGKMRLRGEGILGFFLPGVVTQFRRMLGAKGARGLPMRLYAQTVLKSSGLRSRKEKKS